MFNRAGQRNSNNKDSQFWIQSLSRFLGGNNHPIELSTPQMLAQRLDYLHENPVRAGIVYEPGHYIYSSAIDYYSNKKGKIEIQHLQV